MSAIVGALRVVLSAETAEFQKGMRDTQNRLQSFGADVKKTMVGISAAFAGIAAATSALVVRTLGDVEKMSGMSRALGVPIGRLSELKHAAEMTGVGFETLSSGMSTLATNMANAASDAKSQVALAFKAIGVSVTNANGTLKTSDAVLQEIAERFRGFRDDAGKAALAAQLFGGAGAAMIPLLNRGRDGIAALAEEARKLGVVISQDTEDKARAFSETMTRLRKVKEAVALQISARLAPVFTLLSDRLLSVVRDTRVMDSVAWGLEITLGTFIAGIFRALGLAISAVASAMSLIGQGEFTKAWEAMKTGFVDIRAVVDETAVSMRGLWNGWEATVKRAGPVIAGAVTPIVQSTRAAAEALKRLRDEQRAAIDDIINMPTEQVATKLHVIKAALDSNLISMREYGNTMRRIQAEQTQHYHDMASAVSSSLTTIFAKSKTAAIAAAIINTAQGISRNLAQYPQPIAGIMAAITAATGAAQIRAIRSTNMGGGGGGSGAAAAAPATPTVPMQQSLLVQGLNPGDLFRGEQVAELAKKLLEFQKLGGVVVLQGQGAAR